VAPEHQKWMYDQDPFAAAKMVKDRQQKAAQRQEEPKQSDRSKPSRSNPGSREFENAPEVKMATSLRELVEDTIKKVHNLPYSEDAA
jgi:ATP-dependent RNA helicase DHX57